MSFFPNEDQQALRDAARTFARKEVEPIANRIDHEEHIPVELTRRVADLGFFGLMIPEQYGGLGQSLTTAAIVIEELSKASPSFGGMLSVQIVLCPETVRILGNEEQKQRLLPPSAAGNRLMAYSQTEPAGAMNVPAHLTRLSAEGKNFRLNGAKLFCTQGEAKSYIVNCKYRRGDHDGMASVIVDREMEGFEVAPYEDKLGWRGTNTGGISFNNVLIPPENVLAENLDDSRHWSASDFNFICHAASSLGAAQGLFDKTLEQVKQRKLYGEPMHRAQPIAYWLAQVHSKIQAMRALVYTSARLYEEGRTDTPMMSSVTKYFVCDTAFECTNTLLQMWGGSGIMNSTGVNRYMRDARANMVAEGASEMHTWLIGQMALGLT